MGVLDPIVNTAGDSPTSAELSIDPSTAGVWCPAPSSAKGHLRHCLAFCIAVNTGLFHSLSAMFHALFLIYIGTMSSLQSLSRGWRTDSYIQSSHSKPLHNGGFDPRPPCVCDRRMEERPCPSNGIGVHATVIGMPPRSL